MKTEAGVRQAVSDHIKRFKAENNMNTQDIEEISGISSRSLVSYMAQESLPNLFSAYLLADSMDLTIDALITKPDTP